jgi:hypothetical protein
MCLIERHLEESNVVAATDEPFGHEFYGKEMADHRWAADED